MRMRLKKKKQIGRNRRVGEKPGEEGALRRKVQTKDNGCLKGM